MMWCIWVEVLAILWNILLALVNVNLAFYVCNTRPLYRRKYLYVCENIATIWNIENNWLQSSRSLEIFVPSKTQLLQINSWFAEKCINNSWVMAYNADGNSSNSVTRGIIKHMMYSRLRYPSSSCSRCKYNHKTAATRVQRITTIFYWHVISLLWLKHYNLLAMLLPIEMVAWLSL